MVSNNDLVILVAVVIISMVILGKGDEGFTPTMITRPTTYRSLYTLPGADKHWIPIDHPENECGMPRRSPYPSQHECCGRYKHRYLENSY